MSEQSSPSRPSGKSAEGRTFVLGAAHNSSLGPRLLDSRRQPVPVDNDSTSSDTMTEPTTQQLNPSGSSSSSSSSRGGMLLNTGNAPNQHHQNVSNHALGITGSPDRQRQGTTSGWPPLQGGNGVASNSGNSQQLVGGTTSSGGSSGSNSFSTANLSGSSSPRGGTGGGATSSSGSQSQDPQGASQSATSSFWPFFASKKRDRTDTDTASSTAVPSSDYGSGSTADAASSAASSSNADPNEEDLRRKRMQYVAAATLPQLHTIEPSMRRKSKSGRASICTFKCRSSLRAVRYAIRKLGWEEVTAESADCSVAWLEHGDSVVHLTPYQAVSKIEGMVPICRKAACAISLNRIAKSFPNAYSFVPKTWVLRRDGYDEAVHLEKIMNERKGWVYIAKPTAGSQGRGVQLVKRWPDLKPIVREVWPDGLDKEQQKYRKRVEFVVQRYVTRPLLVNGLKFDCRVYVLVTSITPLRGYLFEEGLARFCTVPYERPKAHNLGNTCMHLTNYAVNKKSIDFQPSRAHDDGSKRSLSSVFDLIYAEEGPSPDTMWQQIKELAERTVLAIKPSLIEHYGYFLQGKVGHHPHGPKGFQIIGLDIIFEDNCRPKLLELNANCSLSCLSPMVDPEGGGVLWKPDQSGPRMEVSALDLAIKSELVAQALLLANPLSHRKSVQGRQEFQEQCGGLPAGSVFQEPLPNEEQRREAKPPRRPDRPQYAPAFRPLDFTTNHQAIFDFVQSHEHTYRLFRGLLAPGQTTFTKNSFRSLVISGYFLYERGLEDSSDEEEEAFRIKIFDDMASADAFFARVLFEANRENNTVANGLNYLQFLKYVCVELGSRIDDTSEFHAIHAFVRRCVGTYEGSNSSESDEEEEEVRDEE
ncbi:unnamed protein product [Amoebophrya sp. A120]|nr:unnamed protein product [Amoebophrya sp. A120]|eukprot:GSA120T00010851001.1